MSWFDYSQIIYECVYCRLFAMRLTSFFHIKQSVPSEHMTHTREHQEVNIGAAVMFLSIANEG